jgi:ribosomal protein L11 methylase PrmA
MPPDSNPQGLPSGEAGEKFFWGCLPFVATPPEVVRGMLALAEVGPSDTVMDLGCGDGRILLAAVEDFKARMAIGYEIRKDLIESVRQTFESKNLSNRVKLVQADLLRADLSEATVIAIYLTATGNDRLRPKFERECQPGTRVISHGFGIDGWSQSKVSSFQGHKVYLYVVPKSFNIDHGDPGSVE